MTDAQITYEQLFDALRREKSRDELQKLDEGFYRLSRLFLADKHDAIISESAGGLGGLGAQRAGIEYQNAKRILRELYDRRERKIVTLAMHRSRSDATVVDISALLLEERMFFDALVDLLSQTRDQVFAAIGVTGVATAAFRPSSASSSSNSAPQYVERNDDAPSSLRDASLPSSYEEPSSSPVGQHMHESFAVDETLEPAPGSGDAQVAVALVRVRMLGAVPKVMSADGKVYGPYAAADEAGLPEDIARVLIKKGRAQRID